MTVFISYRHTDRNTAFNIAHRLNSKKIRYYLDVVDEESNNTEDITEVITKNIKKSTHVLAVISSNTSGSWWVPFEIGEATIANRRICSYVTEENYTHLNQWSVNRAKRGLPDYLNKWPILYSPEDLDEFIAQYRIDNRENIYERLESRQFDNVNSNKLTKSGADSFHRSLKNRL